MKKKSKKKAIEKLKASIHPSEHELLDRLLKAFPNTAGGRLVDGMLEAVDKIKKDRIKNVLPK